MLCKAFSLLAERVSSQSQSERVELADEDQKAWPKIAQALSPAELVDVHHGCFVIEDLGKMLD